MIDPLTSLGLASNIVQLVDFGFRVIGKGRELAVTGSTADYEHLRKLAEDIKSVCDQLQQQNAPSSMHAYSTRAVETLHPTEAALFDLANRTKGVANDLESLMARLTISGTNDDDNRPTKRARFRRSHAIWAAAKGAWKEEEISQLRAKMTDLQLQMALHLSVMQSTSTSTLLRSIGPSTSYMDEYRACRLAAYEKTIPLILARVGYLNVAAGDDDTDDPFAPHLEKLAHQARTVTTCQAVLHSLAFEEIHSRQEAIVDAHAETFEWVFDDESTDFGEWASSKNGIFWITGKPGSGKSTLMKYIVRHRQTTSLLEQWAGQDDLIVAHHFFWNAGTSLQRSQAGLLRTLLFHVVQQSPETALEVIPERFKNNAAGQALPWTHDELCESIRSFGLKNKYGTRLVFFVDGLDEYVGEHEDLVQLLSTFASGPCIKMCVSSRPWNVFTRAYHRRTDGELKVQDLTGADIREYVTNTLGANPLFRELRDRHRAACRSLVEDITTKAEGVFLWVYLVVRSLLRGLTNNDSMKTLRRRLVAYPSSLDGYFQRMFDRVENVYQKESARFMLAAMSAQSALPFWAPRCVEIEIENPDYALEVSVPLTADDRFRVYGCDCLHSESWISDQDDDDQDDNSQESMPLQSSDPNDVQRQCLFCQSSYTAQHSEERERLKRYLDSRCADLFEVSHNGITFVHRTAKDFLEQGDLSVSLYARAEDEYDVGLTLSRLNLAEAKCMSSSESRSWLLSFLLQSPHAGQLEATLQAFLTSRKPDSLTSCKSDIEIPNARSQSVMFSKLSTYQNLVRERNMLTYAALFNDLEAKLTGGAFHGFLNRPASVTAAVQKKEMRTYDYAAASLSDTGRALEELFNLQDTFLLD